MAGLQRLREVEKQYKRLQMEHDLLKKSIRFASEPRAKSSHSRRVLGWSPSDRRDAALTTQALRRAASKRQAGPGVVFHSDRGTEYAATEFRGQTARLGKLQSMNRAGKMKDNAHMESFFHSMKCEELYGKTFGDEGELRRALSSYVAFYNRERLHASLCYLPPATFELRHLSPRCGN